MQGVPDEIKRRQVALFTKCDPEFGAGVGKAMELDPGKAQT
jgi:catalase